MWNTQLCEPGYEVTSVRSIYRHFAWLCHLHEVSAVNNRQTRRHSNVYINRFLKNEPHAWISELNYNTKQLQALKSWCFWLNLKSTGSAHRKQIFYSTVWLYSLTEILIELYSFFFVFEFPPVLSKRCGQKFHLADIFAVAISFPPTDYMQLHWDERHLFHCTSGISKDGKNSTFAAQMYLLQRLKWHDFTSKGWHRSNAGSPKSKRETKCAL